MLIEFPRNLNLALYYLHNRHAGEVVFVWQNGPEFAFTLRDNYHLPAGRDWVRLGSLAWRVEGDRFMHYLRPLRGLEISLNLIGG
jgi:hypothetical protein